jgi:LmbE family N-acetylglucosaminyl deacetylase
MARLTALCVVAHPDDCIIFAWPFIVEHRKFEWSILYLTYHSTDARAIEVATFWRKRGIPVEFLGNVDNYMDIEHKMLSFNPYTAHAEIVSRCSKADLILTHSRHGDYGHIHHKFVHNCVIASAKPAVFFASEQESNLTCTRIEKLDLLEIPLHADVVQDFQNIESGNYLIDANIRNLIYDR